MPTGLFFPTMIDPLLDVLAFNLVQISEATMAVYAGALNWFLGQPDARKHLF